MTSNTPTDEKHRTDDRKYESLLSIIAHNTGGSKMPIIIRKSTLNLTFCQKRDYQPNDFNTAISKAMERNDIIMQMGSNNHAECALTLSGAKNTNATYPYRECNISEFESMTERERQKKKSNDKIIRWANQHISHIKSDDDHISIINSTQRE